MQAYSKRTPANYLSISLDIYHCYIVAAAALVLASWIPTISSNIVFVSIFFAWVIPLSAPSVSSAVCECECVCRICVRYLFFTSRERKRISRLSESVDSMEVDLEKKKPQKLSIDRGNRKQCWSLSHRKIYFKCFFARACLSICFVAYSPTFKGETKRSKVHGTAIHVHTTRRWRPFHTLSHLSNFAAATKSFESNMRHEYVECIFI